MPVDSLPGSPTVRVMGIAREKLPKKILAQLELETAPEVKSKKGFFASKGEGNTYKRAPVEQRTLDGVVFDSKYEMIAFDAIRHFVAPQFLQKQPVFLLLPKKTITTRGQIEKIKAMTWKADFLIGPPRVGDEDPIDQGQMIIDIKGQPTEQFKVRLKLFKWRYETIPYVTNVNSKARLELFVATVLRHCEQWHYLA